MSASACARVLLVGRTPIERTLRRAPGLELLRARSPLDAIAEAAQACDEGEPVSAVVLGDSGLAPAEHTEFLDALNSFANGAVIVDTATTDADALVARLTSPLRGHQDPDDHDPAPPPAPAEPASGKDRQTGSAPAGSPSQSGPAADHVASTAAAEALLTGRDPTEPILDAARAALADSTITFTPRAETDKPAPVPDAGVAVARAGGAFGTLTADNTAPDRLARLADELALWLALAEQQRQLRRAAFTDQLTGANNRRWFDYAFPRALDKARDERRDVTVMVYDIDDFKTYNDCFGHAAGDEILRETVRLLISVIRPSDRVCRIGGDEFVVIFDDPSGPRVGAGHHPTEIAAIAGRFQRQICEHRFPKLSNEAPGTLTISGGLATFPWDGASPEALLARADALALESKRAGKNLITFGPGARRVCGIDPGTDA